MKKLFLLLILNILPLIIFSQQQFGNNSKESKNYTFGVRIVPTDRGVGRFYAIYSSNNEISKITTLSKKNFVKIASGLQSSNHNIYEINYFTEYGVIDSAKLMKNIVRSIRPQRSDNNFDEDFFEYQKKNRYNHSVTFLADSLIGNLWKLRFAKYPYGGTLDTMGWTNNFDNKYMPRPEQMDILRGYGIDRIDDYIWGDNFFRLLKDCRNPAWRQAYSEAGTKE